MMERPASRWLDDGRLALSHGPIDLILSAEGPAADVAYDAATRRFDTILEELAAELPHLRAPDMPVGGAVAHRMAAATGPHRPATYVTPMAAVAGAVADEILAAMRSAGPLTRAIVNNGGDIAIHLAPGTTANARIAFADGSTAGNVHLCAEDPIRGIATSGRHGRSLSLGIADSVTALASTAAAADAAATLIANGVDLVGHPSVTRVLAEELDPDSDLAGRLVTTACAPLHRVEIAAALSAGATVAESMRERGLIAAAALFLQGRVKLVGPHFKPLSPKEWSNR
ncbi:MAG: UPF0280 family protein [Pseudomonadota bacterium]